MDNWFGARRLCLLKRGDLDPLVGAALIRAYLDLINDLVSSASFYKKMD